MGIQGLLPFIRKSCRPANLKDFSGSTVAIDAYSWLHKGAFSCAEKLVKGEQTDGYVYYCMKYLNLIIEAGVTPIMVFDGCNLPSKAGTEKKRRENRERTRQRGKELLCEGKVKEARECFQRCVDVTPEMAREVILACKKKSIDCIVAPYEADAQLAYLAKTGIAQLIITEDSDLILFGCNRILFKMDCNGTGLLFEKENLPKSFGAKSSKFSFEKFQYMCILSGCDYLPSLPGIGLAKAFKFFSLTANTDLASVLPKLPSYLKMPQLTVPKEYIESFIKAYNTFLYQLVFCPREKKFVPLNPYPEGVNPDEMEYAGKYLPADVACQLAMGNINVKTMEEFDDSQSDNSSVWDDTSAAWGSQFSQKHTKSSQKELVSAFVFNSQKRKSSALSNCIKTDMVDVDNTGGDASTNEELFAMYRVQTPEDDLTAKSFEELAMNSFEDDLALESFEDDSDIINTEDETPTSSQSSSHPRELNMPFRKITRSRFFASEDGQSSKNVKVTKEDKCDVSPSIKISLLEENNFKEDCNSSIAPKIQSPVKENKENFRNIFAKRKVVTCVEESPSKKMKSSALIDTIDDESVASTSTVSSSGLASKLITSTKSDFITPASPKSFFNSRKKPKLYKTTKLSSFDWKNLSDGKTQLNSSLGSDSNSSFEIERELEEVIRAIPSPDLPGGTSPFFSTPVDEETPEELQELFLLAAESSLEHIDSTIKKEPIEPDDSLFPTPASSHESVNSPTSVEVKKELLDEDSSDIQVLYSSTERKSLGNATGSKVLKPIDNKTSSGLKRLSELNIDVKGVARGRCSCGMCDAFLLPNPNDLSHNGWCIYCNHPPVQHEALKEPNSNSVPIMQEASHHQDEIAIQETVGSSKSLVSKEQEDVACIRESSVAKPPFKLFPLPEFPSFLTPLLYGHSMAPNIRKKLSQGVKDQLIAFLDRENLICTGNTTERRWEYNLLGKTLAYKYPKMLWDVGKNTQSKCYKKERPNYTVFIKRMSHSRKVRRWRMAGKMQKTASDEETTNKTSPEEDFLELQNVFMKRMSQARKTRELRKAGKLQKTVSDEQTSNETSPEDERLELEVLNEEEDNASIKESPVTEASTKPPSKLFPLPEFSSYLIPFLNGDSMAEKDQKKLSLALKKELIAFLNRENLICSGNTTEKRWEYDVLGKTLAYIYPKMLWDVAENSQKKCLKKERPNYTVFIKRMSTLRKIQRLRAAEKVQKAMLKEDTANETSLEDEVVVFKVEPEKDCIEESPATMASTKPSFKLFPLPEFSSILKPLLNGHSMSPSVRKSLSQGMKNQLIAFLDRETLICTGNTTERRWEYDLLGKTLAYKYPKMLWDVEENSRKTVSKKRKTPIYGLFIKRMSHVRKTRRLRIAGKIQDETSPEDAVLELKFATSDLMDQETYVTRICSLLKISYELRREEEYSELPAFLLSQTCLETETELRLDLSMVVMEERLNKTLKMFATTYQMEASVWELQKLVQPIASGCTAVTMEAHNPLSSCIPGPTLFCGDKKTLVAGSQSITLRDNCTLQRATVLLLGLYLVLNLSFPKANEKFLKLLQDILNKGKK